jgi:predicted ATP-grasp superfamily ATP-dependent carboligase
MAVLPWPADQPAVPKCPCAGISATLAARYSGSVRDRFSKKQLSDIGTSPSHARSGDALIYFVDNGRRATLSWRVSRTEPVKCSDEFAFADRGPFAVLPLSTKNLSVLVLDDASPFAVDVARCLARIPALAIHVLSGARYPAIRLSNTYSSFHHTQWTDADELFARVSRVAEQTEADIVLAVDEPAVGFLCRYGDSLRQSVATGLVPQLDAFEITADKGLLADFLARSQIPHPPTIRFTNSETFAEAIRTLPVPLLLKPCRGSNGSGIAYFDDSRALLALLEKDPGFTRRFVVQHYIPGFDIDCSVLCQQGEVLAYTIQRPFLPSVRFRPPPGFDFVMDEQTLDVVKRLVAALQWSGVAHIDLRYDERDGRVQVLEVNPRYWGSLLGSLAAGVNFPYLACLAGLKIPSTTPTYRNVRFVSGSWAIRSWLHRPPNGKPRFAFAESSLKYLLADPLPALHGPIVRCWSRAQHRLTKGLSRLHSKTPPSLVK